MLKKIQISIGFILVSILVVYSPEVKFMPHHFHRPDKWHLFFPMMLFSFAFFLVFNWLIVVMYKQKKIQTSNLIQFLLALFLFGLTNTTDKNIIVIGYLGIFVLFIMQVFFFWKNKDVIEPN